MENFICGGERHAIGGPGTFILGDAAVTAESLAERFAGKITLIYLDPPFSTGDVFVKAVSGHKSLRIPAYRDDLAGDEYIAYMKRLLIACKKLLSPQGSIYLHCDHRMNAQLRLLLDDVFGQRCFMNEIIWAYNSGGRSTRYYPRKHDTILFYRRSPKVFFNIKATGMPRGREKRNHMKYNVDNRGRVYYSIRTAGRLYKYYEDDLVFPSDVWTDIEHLHQRHPERTGFSTQKPEALLRRIIAASTREYDTVCDFFSGSGTTAAVAGAMKRRFIVCDASPVAMATLRERLLTSEAAFSLIDERHELELKYPSVNQSIPGLNVSVERKGTSVKIEMHSSASVPISYISGGVMDGGEFIPLVDEFEPGSVYSAQFDCGRDIVVMVVDAYGNQQFSLHAFPDS